MISIKPIQPYPSFVYVRRTDQDKLQVASNRVACAFTNWRLGRLQEPLSCPKELSLNLSALIKMVFAEHQEKSARIQIVLSAINDNSLPWRGTDDTVSEVLKGFVKTCIDTKGVFNSNFSYQELMLNLQPCGLLISNIKKILVVLEQQEMAAFFAENHLQPFKQLLAQFLAYTVTKAHVFYSIEALGSQTKVISEEKLQDVEFFIKECFPFHREGNLEGALEIDRLHKHYMHAQEVLRSRSLLKERPEKQLLRFEESRTEKSCIKRLAAACVCHQFINRHITNFKMAIAEYLLNAMWWCASSHYPVETIEGRRAIAESLDNYGKSLTLEERDALSKAFLDKEAIQLFASHDLLEAKTFIQEYLLKK